MLVHLKEYQKTQYPCLLLRLEYPVESVDQFVAAAVVILEVTQLGVVVTPSVVLEFRLE